MQCSKCGGVNSAGAVVCKYCNAPMNVTAEKAKEPTRKSAKTESLQKEIKSRVRMLTDDFLLNAAMDFYNGIDVEQDKDFAAYLFEQLALRGNAEGAYYYAQLLMENGSVSGVSDAIYWFGKAAEKGHEAAKNTLDWLTRHQAESQQQPSTLPPAIAGNDALAGLSAEALRAVVRIVSGNSTGAGFIVEGGYVVTNAHVIGARKTDITATFDPSVSENTYSLKLLKIDPPNDIAVLSFTGAAKDKLLKEAANGERHFFSLRNGIAQLGEPVYTIGNPLGLGISLSAGHISNPQSDKVFGHPWKYSVVTDITVNGGNSGGALLDYQNRVVGIITCHPVTQIGSMKLGDTGLPVYGGANGMSFCVPAESIENFLKGVK